MAPILLKASVRTHLFKRSVVFVAVLIRTLTLSQFAAFTTFSLSQFSTVNITFEPPTEDCNLAQVPVRIFPTKQPPDVARNESVVEFKLAVMPGFWPQAGAGKSLRFRIYVDRDKTGCQG